MRRPGMVSHSESSLKAISRMSPPHAGHSSGNSFPTWAMSFARAIREVSCETDSGSSDSHSLILRRTGTVPAVVWTSESLFTAEIQVMSSSETSSIDCVAGVDQRQLCIRCHASPGEPGGGRRPGRQKATPRAVLRFPARPAKPLNRQLQPRQGHRLEDVVERAVFKRRHRSHFRFGDNDHVGLQAHVGQQLQPVPARERDLQNTTSSSRPERNTRASVSIRAVPITSIPPISPSSAVKRAVTRGWSSTSSALSIAAFIRRPPVVVFHHLHRLRLQENQASCQPSACRSRVCRVGRPPPASRSDTLLRTTLHFFQRFFSR